MKITHALVAAALLTVALPHVSHAQEDGAAKSSRVGSDPMAPFGITARIGLAGQGKRDATIDGDTLKDAFEGTPGLHMGVGLNLGGGAGFGTDINFAIRRFNRSTEVLGQSFDYKSGDFTLETIFGARLHLMDPLYMFVGAGPRLGMGWEKVQVGRYVAGNEDNTYGIVGIRVPVQVTYYLLGWLALTLEFGIGWDIRMTAIDTPNPPNPLDPGRVFYHDQGLTYDVVLGVRFF